MPRIPEPEREIETSPFLMAVEDVYLDHRRAATVAPGRSACKVKVARTVQSSASKDTRTTVTVVSRFSVKPARGGMQVITPACSCAAFQRRTSSARHGAVKPILHQAPHPSSRRVRRVTCIKKEEGGRTHPSCWLPPVSSTIQRPPTDRADSPAFTADGRHQRRDGDAG